MGYISKNFIIFAAKINPSMNIESLFQELPDVSQKSANEVALLHQVIEKMRHWAEQLEIYTHPTDTDFPYNKFEIRLVESVGHAQLKLLCDDPLLGGSTIGVNIQETDWDEQVTQFQKLVGTRIHYYIKERLERLSRCIQTNEKLIAGQTMERAPYVNLRVYYKEGASSTLRHAIKLLSDQEAPSSIFKEKPYYIMLAQVMADIAPYIATLTDGVVSDENLWMYVTEQSATSLNLHIYIPQFFKIHISFGQVTLDYLSTFPNDYLSVWRTYFAKFRIQLQKLNIQEYHDWQHRLEQLEKK